MLQRGVGGTSIVLPYGEGAFSVAAADGAIAYRGQSRDRPSDVAVLRGGKSHVLTALNDDILPHLDFARIEEIKVGVHP